MDRPCRQVDRHAGKDIFHESHFFYGVDHLHRQYGHQELRNSLHGSGIYNGIFEARYVGRMVRVLPE